MTTAVRSAVVAVLTLHGLIHLLGTAKGFGWADVAALTQPVGGGAGVLWLVAAALVLTSAWFVARGGPTWWWAVAASAAVVSQIAIATSWHDARAGTAVNVLLALVAAYGFASVGPTSFRAQWRDQATRALADVDPAPPLVDEVDLTSLPGPLAAYVRRSGAVGRPRVTSVRATFHGRIRSGADQTWMPFTGEQLNTYGPRPQRAFIMDASRSGLPVTVLHQFANGTATMRAKVLSALTVVDAAGPEMDRGETVTVFNDLVVLAPGAILGAPVRWTAVDAHHVRGVFSDGTTSVAAVLTFDDQSDLVDFTSDDRLRASPDGTSFTPQGWSTPVSGHRVVGGRRVMAAAEARWQAPPPEGPFSYVELALDEIAYNVTSAVGTPDRALRTPVAAPS